MSDVDEIRHAMHRFQESTAAEAVKAMLQQAAVYRERADRCRPSRDGHLEPRRLRGRAKQLEGTAEVIAAQHGLPAPEVPS
jgi:hypothetical protein